MSMAHRGQISDLCGAGLTGRRALLPQKRCLLGGTMFPGGFLNEKNFILNVSGGNFLEFFQYQAHNYRTFQNFLSTENIRSMLLHTANINH